MNNRDEHIVRSLRRWIQGDIDQKEENRLDRQAREDAFLGEALEGYRQFSGSEHQERLDRMRGQLHASTQKQKKRGGVLLTMPFRIAAAASVILVVGLFWWINPTTKAELAEAQQTEQLNSTSALQEETTTAAESAEPLNTPLAFESAKRETSTDSQPLSDPPELDSSFPDETTVAAIPEEIPEMEEEGQLLTKSEDRVLAFEARNSIESQKRAEFADSAPASPSPTDGVTIGGVKRVSSLGTRLVTGKVLDQSGFPLNGVLVVTPEDRIGTITDLDGQYELRLDSNVQKLDFEAAGYSTQRVNIGDTQDFVQVTLDEAEPLLDEVVVSGEKAKNRKRNKIKPLVSASSANLEVAKPSVSLRRFQRNLQRNLAYPQEAIDQNISGSVTLRFVILPDGRAANIKAISGPAELQQEAIRLIEQGPRWEITNGNGKSITFTYRLDFSL